MSCFSVVEARRTRGGFYALGRLVLLKSVSYSCKDFHIITLVVILPRPPAKRSNLHETWHCGSTIQRGGRNRSLP